MSLNLISNYIASISAFVGCCSAFISFLSYRKLILQNKINKNETFIFNCRSKLDDCYMALSDFVNSHHNANESKDKRIEREKILYLLDIYRPDIDQNEYISKELKQNYYSLSIKISDITFEKNFEKIIKDLGFIKNSISTFKNKLIHFQ